MEMLHHDTVEFILERLPAKLLLTFKRVSKRWRSTIQSRDFQEKQFMRIHGGEPEPDLLLLYTSHDRDLVGGGLNIQQVRESTRRRPRIYAVKIPVECSFVSRTSCDGLVFFYNILGPGLVANPTTRWSRSFPPSRIQELTDKFLFRANPFPHLGFGKDSLPGTFKPVCLYNSSELDLEKATTCEVFDFSTNAWRYVVPSAPLRIIPLEPLFFDESLHWFTDGEEETKVLSFHLHTETFRVISKALPFVAHENPQGVTMCSINNHLCVSQKKDFIQTIWSYESSDNTWAERCSINLSVGYWIRKHTPALSLLAVPSTTREGYTKVLLYIREYNYTCPDDKQRLILYDPIDNYYDLPLEAASVGIPLCYSQSLISIP